MPTKVLRITTRKSPCGEGESPRLLCSFSSTDAAAHWQSWLTVIARISVSTRSMLHVRIRLSLARLLAGDEISDPELFKRRKQRFSSAVRDKTFHCRSLSTAIAHRQVPTPGTASSCASTSASSTSTARLTWSSRSPPSPSSRVWMLRCASRPSARLLFRLFCSLDGRRRVLTA